MAAYRILVVDDDLYQRELLETYLTLSNYQVTTAENGIRAMEQLKNEKPDLILLDVLMPGMDGFQTLTAIRKRLEFRNIPVLMLTSLDRLNLIVKGLEKGADDYIIKPFDKAELLARVKAALRRSERYGPAEGLLEGNLADILLSDLLQSLELAAKTAAIYLEDVDGEIFLEEGALVHARQGRFVQGAATEGSAIGRILLIETGPFTVRFDELPPNLVKNPQVLMSVLMKEIARVDEISSALEQVNPQRRPVILAEELGEFSFMEEHRRTMPMDLKALVAAMEKDIESNLRSVLTMLKQGILKFVAVPGE